MAWAPVITRWTASVITVCHAIDGSGNTQTPCRRIERPVVFPLSLWQARHGRWAEQDLTARRDDRLDAARDRQQAPIRPAPANDHQTDRRGTWRLDRQRDRAPVEKVDDRRVPQDKPVQAGVFTVVGERA